MIIFSNFQFRFRKTLLISSITESFTSKQQLLGILLDLSKAFDTINHTIQNCIITVSNAYLCNGSKAISATENWSKLRTYHQQKFILPLTVFHKSKFLDLYCFCSMLIIFLIA